MAAEWWESSSTYRDIQLALEQMLGIFSRHTIAQLEEESETYGRMANEKK